MSAYVSNIYDDPALYDLNVALGIIPDVNDENLDSFVGPHTKSYYDYINGNGSINESSSANKVATVLPDSFEGSMDRLYRIANDAQSRYQTLSSYAAMMKDAEEAQKNRDFQQESADKAMRFSAAQAQLQRNYETEMSNSAYQRAVSDMKKAGLNPILLTSKGFSGASTPSVSAPGGSYASGSSARGYVTSGSTAEVQTSGQIREQETKLLSSALSLVSTIIGAIILKGKKG